MNIENQRQKTISNRKNNRNANLHFSGGTGPQTDARKPVIEFGFPQIYGVGSCQNNAPGPKDRDYDSK